MALDGVVSKVICEELNSFITDMRIDKIYMPGKNEVVLSLRSPQGAFRLSINVNPSHPRVHLTRQKKDNPSSPPMFCMLLRKYISSGRITAVRSYKWERLIDIHIESTDEMGDMSEKRLIVELVGKLSNLVLVNEKGIIIDCLKHVDNEMSELREVMPARNYIYPPLQEGKVTPEEFDARSFADKIGAEVESYSRVGASLEGKETTCGQYIVNSIMGFSPLIAKEICLNADVDFTTPICHLAQTQMLLLAAETKKCIAAVQEAIEHPTPSLFYDENNKEVPRDFYCLPLRQFSNTKQMQTISHVLDEFYIQKAANESFQRAKNDLLRVVNSNIERCSKKMSLQKKSVQQASDYEELMKTAELLKANLHLVEEGMEEVTVADFYCEGYPERIIRLQPSMTPQQNLQKMFRRYEKKKKTYIGAGEQLHETQQEYDYLESVANSLSIANNMSEISDIKRELKEEKYLKLTREELKAKQALDRKRAAIIKKNGKYGKRALPKKDNASAITLPRRYVSSDGFIIYAGRNNVQNDRLTLHSSAKDDIWLHTQKIPGSHVIISSHGKNVPSTTLEEAANISACLSRAKQSANVSVDYTQVKNVWKAKGAKPGMVLYENFKTLVVTPNEVLLKKLSDDKEE